MCSQRNEAPAEVPAIGTPCGVAPPQQPRHGGAAQRGGQPELVAAGEEHAAWPRRSPRGRRLLGLGALVEPQHLDRGHAHGPEQRVVLRAGLGPARGGRDHRDPRLRAAGKLDEPAQDGAVAQPLLGAADRDDVSRARRRRSLLPGTRELLLLSLMVRAGLIPGRRGQDNALARRLVSMRHPCVVGLHQREGGADAGDRRRGRRGRPVGRLGAQPRRARARRPRQGAIPNPLSASHDRHRLIRLAHSDGDGRGLTIHDAYAAWDRLVGGPRAQPLRRDRHRDDRARPVRLGGRAAGPRSTATARPTRSGTGPSSAGAAPTSPSATATGACSPPAAAPSTPTASSTDLAALAAAARRRRCGPTARSTEIDPDRGERDARRTASGCGRTP